MENKATLHRNGFPSLKPNDVTTFGKAFGTKRATLLPGTQTEN